MKPPAILVPFKGTQHKSRLGPILGQAERIECAFLLLEDTLSTVRRAGLSRQCYVVSSEERAREVSKRAGARFIREKRSLGVNSAVRLGVRTLRGANQFVVLPSDLAMLTVPDLEVALGLAKEGWTVIAPSSSFNGTNLMIFPKRMTRWLSYDDNSFWNHLASAARTNLRTAVLTSSGLVFDLDTPADAMRLSKSKTRSKAASFLRRKGVL